MLTITEDEVSGSKNENGGCCCTSSSSSFFVGGTSSSMVGGGVGRTRSAGACILLLGIAWDPLIWYLL